MKTWQRLKRNSKLWEQYLVREKVIDGTREFFKSSGFHEVFTPIMVPIPSCEANLEPHKTELVTSRGIKKTAFLIMSPEYSIKKLLAAGLGNCFEITKVFRNGEEVSPQHNSEFTMLEWYRTEADYRKIMEDMEKLMLFLVKKKSLLYQGQKYDLSTPWPRISVAEAFEQYAGINIDTLVDQSRLINKAKEKGYQIDKDNNYEQVFYQMFFNEVEPKLRALNKPYFLYDYPVQQASLARRKPEDPRFAERFEVFMAGMELGNCFSELTDAKEQEERFKEDMTARQQAGKSLYPIDLDLIEALESLSPTAGIAVGLDRIIMLIANVASVAETMLFPEKELFDL